MTNDKIKKQILDFISDSFQRVTQNHLLNEFSEKYLIPKKDIKSAVKSLIQENELIYTNTFGCSFLEKSFNKPVRISGSVVLKPPEIFYQAGPGDIVVEISKGASFGTGEHPTTRLAVSGIEYVLKENGLIRNKNCALDIGTGSGILVITAVLMGMTGAVGTDIDTCAVAEAKENVRLNQLDDRIKICLQDVSESEKDRQFDLILANLRYPTLKRLCSHLSEITEKSGCIVISGIKTDEISDLISLYTANHFHCKWQKEDKGWAGIVFEKRLDVFANRSEVTQAS